MAAMMRAGIATESGIAIHEIPRPTPGDEEVLVHVRAAGVDRADLGDAKARPNVPLTVVGLEWAGEVVAVGPRVTNVKRGDYVICTGTGGYAEYAVTDAGRAIPFNPREIKIEQAGSMGLGLLTTHDALVTHGRLQPGQSVLVNGASSGMGQMALQVAKLQGAALIAGTSRSEEHRKRLPELGATLVLDSSKPDWADLLLKATDNRGVDVVIDMVSGNTVNDSMKASAVRARIVNVGRLAGGHADFDFNLHAFKRIEYTGVTFRTRSIQEIRDIVNKMLADLGPAVREGKLTVPVEKVFKLDDAAAAHAMMAANDHFGKLVVVP